MQQFVVSERDNKYIENGVLLNGQQLQCGKELGFDSVEGMKMLNVRGNSSRDERQFRAKTTVSTRTNLEL